MLDISKEVVYATAQIIAIFIIKYLITVDFLDY